MKKFWFGVGAVGIILAGVYARGGGGGGRGMEGERGMGGAFSERNDMENYRPENRGDMRREGTAGQRFSENRVHEGERGLERGVESPNAMKKDAEQFHQQYQTEAAKPLTPTVNPTINTSKVNETIRQNYPHMGNWFGNNFWANHGLNPYFNTERDWWAATDWAAASGWIGAGDATPLYYDPNGTTTAATPTTTTTPAPAPTTTADAEPVNDWIPLGVFAVGTDTVDPSNTNLFLQLAVDKEGQVEGTYYNSSTDQAQKVSGYLNKSTQQITWEITGSFDSPIMQTGLYNLTQDQTPIKVIMGDTSVQTWSLVKIKK